MPRTRLHNTIAKNAATTIEPNAPTGLQSPSTEPSLEDQLVQVEGAIDAQAKRVEELQAAIDALESDGRFLPADEGARNLLEGLQALLDAKQSERERSEALEATGSLLAKETRKLEELETERRHLAKRIRFEVDKVLMAAAIAQAEQKFEAASKLYKEALEELGQAEAQVDRSVWGNCIIQELNTDSMQSHMIQRELTLVYWSKSIPHIMKELPKLNRIRYGVAVRS